MSYLKITSVITLIILFVVTDYVSAADLGYKEGELLVRFAPKENKHQRTKSEKEAILSSINGGTIKHSHDRIVPGLSLVKLPQGQTVDKNLSKFKKTAGILYAEPNYKVKIAATGPNDPKYHEQWGLSRISAPAAWDINHDACDIIVAVIDTGVDYTHKDLAANMWADANGSHGYDFVNDDNDPMEDRHPGHGTHCAGIIAAVGDNNTGVTGVCWHAKIMAVKFIKNFLRYHSINSNITIG